VTNLDRVLSGKGASGEFASAQCHLDCGAESCANSPQLVEICGLSCDLSSCSSEGLMKVR